MTRHTFNHPMNLSLWDDDLSYVDLCRQFGEAWCNELKERSTSIIPIYQNFMSEDYYDVETIMSETSDVPLYERRTSRLPPQILFKPRENANTNVKACNTQKACPLYQPLIDAVDEVESKLNDFNFYP